MEQVAVMMPSSVVNTDELSDETESINLDLHVSDTEDSTTESSKKCDVENNDQTESEDDILNKYIDDTRRKHQKKLESDVISDKDKLEPPTLPNGTSESDVEDYKKCNGTISPIGNIEEEDVSNETLVSENDGNLNETLLVEEDHEKMEMEETSKSSDAVKNVEASEIDSKVEECKEKENKSEENVLNEEDSEIGCSDKQDSEQSITDKQVDGDEEMDIEESEDLSKVCEETEEIEKVHEETENINKVCDEPEVCEETGEINKVCEETEEINKVCEETKETDKVCEETKEIDKVFEETKEINKVCEETEITKDTSDKSETVSGPVEESSSKETTETKTDDNEDNDDLLCVMDEKTVEEADDTKDENSCSASEKGDEAKESEENTEDNAEESNEAVNNQETKEDEDMEQNSESQVELDMDASECAMDIEESDIGGVVYTEQNRDVRIEQISSESRIEVDKDANKENEHVGDVTLTDGIVKDSSTSENCLVNGIADEESKEDDVIQTVDGEEDKEAQKKSTKRQLSDSSTEDESAKKIKLQTEEEEEVEKSPEKEKRPIIKLNSFNKFMLDKKLKSLSRFELEEFCIQKICECIVNKSEIGELRQKVMIQEQTIDTWRKEAIVVAKQTRDLKIVHERLMADLKVMKEQTGKPLVPVKITRSVGLQAIIENSARIRPGPIVNGMSTPPQRGPAVNNNQQQNKAIPIQNRQPIKPKVSPQRSYSNNNINRTLQPISQKDNLNNNSKSKQTSSSPQQNKKNSDPKAVIDLTDEDEKSQNAKQTTNTASPTVRVLNKQNTNTNTPAKPNATTPTSQASKIMFVSPNVLQRNSAVVVKMNSNSVVTTQNGITSIPNGQVSVVSTPTSRTVSQVRVPVSSVTTVRTTTPPKPVVYKHPAPLPAAPNYQTNMAGRKPIPPKPHLNLTRSSCGTGIVLQWKMPYKLDSYETIVSYQLYAYQETKSPPKTDNWGKIGDVKALELPMAVTLTQFAVGNRYFFAVRAVDGQKRLGPFSEPENILL